jgi:Xaa-Pro dipeptidase
MSEEAFYSAGGSAYRVPMAMFREHRKKLATRMRAEAGVASDGVVVLQGGKATCRNDTDHEPLFRQESFFQYLFGVKEPDCFGAVVLDEAARSLLFVPRLPEHYAVWMGEIKSLAWFAAHYGVDECHYADEIGAVLGKLTRSLYVLRGVNSDSGATHAGCEFDGIEKFNVDHAALFAPLVECRVVKSAHEIALMRHVVRVSSDAHVAVMRRVRPGLAEFQVEALFRYFCYDQAGFRHAAYTCICASANNSATLHYGHAGAPNDRTLAATDMLLFDMGGEYAAYGADITRSYPVSGTFDARQRLVYSTVLAAQDAVLAALKPGVSYVDMHLLAERTMLGELARHGLLRGDVEAMMACRLGAVFMPHGLGHLLGLDTHDVGGYQHGAPRRIEPGLKSLRLSRTMLPGMILTVEPGCYFIDRLLDLALADDTQKHFVVADRINEFRGFGGVRIEDDVLITETGVENLTTAPRTIADIEAVMAQKLPMPLDLPKH